ncbi:uncharacterized protein LOC116709664 isoform X2 [Xiphophorus hellerii]|uniref:uncharacterized protein LOC116709664 isoform X2 n=1 Tax=Xiphophorus hellerii TaxID=8084 RepID=UPI0013B3FF0B|nr:uncharacterized protein LOC116709664 isoform X2 [Xiphophorus hellerii]
MSPLAVNHRWMLVLKIFVLFVILLLNHFCKASGTKKKHSLKNILFLSVEEIPIDPHFPSDVVFKEENGTHLCFNIQANQSNAGCCGIEDFVCSTNIVRLNVSTYSLTVSREILLKHDIVVLLNPMSNFSCMLSKLHNSTEFILDLHTCLKPGGRNIRITLDHLYQNQYNDAQTCEDSDKYMFKFGSKITSIVKIISCETSDSAGIQQPLNLTFPYSNNVMTLQEAVTIMNNFSFYQDQMGAFRTAFIKIGNVTGAITKLQPQDQSQTAFNFGFTASGDVEILKERNNVDMDLDVQIQFSNNASEMAVNKNSTYVGVLLFPGMTNVDHDGYFFNKKVLGIEMGANILKYLLSINIHFNNVNLSGTNMSCMSWDGKGDDQIWSTNNCRTNQVNGSITCQCSHQAFFAIGMTVTLKKMDTFSWIIPEISLNGTLSSPLNPAQAVTIMKKLDIYFAEMNQSKTAKVQIANITGVIAKLEDNSTEMKFGFKSNGDITGGESNGNDNGVMTEIHLPQEAIAMAIKNKRKYVGVLRFPEMPMNQNNTNELYNNEVIGIEMGENIKDLNQTVNIHYSNLKKDGSEAVCVSWDGTNETDWIIEGCKTKINNGITCECSHLTFFTYRMKRSTAKSTDSNKEEEKTSGKTPEKTLSFPAPANPLNSDEAANFMKNLNSLLEQMGNVSTAAIQMGGISGVISKLPQQNQTKMDFGFTSAGDVKILEESNNTGFARAVHFPKEASEKAVNRNGSFSGVLLFPDIPELNKTSYFFNNEMMGIEMGVNISNLSETIDIHFSNVNTTGFNVSCVSWDGRSKDGGIAKWITDGCLTNEENGSITCQCSHLTFFAILMSGTEKISSSDLKALTQITKAGCGISLFFLGVALFMHFLTRKTKASQAIKILMNLFIALFLLNLCFLVNESIAKLKILAACVAMASVLHYSMLATFTWFFMQALHLYFYVFRIPTDTKYYMYKICITGWVIPVVVVVGLLASSKYGYIDISDDNGTSVTMCWIPDSAIYLSVNIGYYGIVFIFTLPIFVATIVQIKQFVPKEAKAQESTKKRLFSLLGLFCLLGITWGFAFFSYGPLLLPSYYIFTILNSFQGFFLFVYYYFSSKDPSRGQQANQEQ